MSKKARPFSRQAAKARRARTEASATKAQAKRREDAQERRTSNDAERAGRMGQMAAGKMGRSASFYLARSGVYTSEQLALLAADYAAWNAAMNARRDARLARAGRS